MESIKMDTYFPFWEGHLITEAYLDLLFGLYRGYVRLEGKQFLITHFKQEFDSDGLTEDIDLLDGFDTFDEAETYVNDTASRLLHKQLELQSDSFSVWHLVDRGAIPLAERQPVSCGWTNAALD